MKRPTKLFVLAAAAAFSLAFASFANATVRFVS